MSLGSRDHIAQALRQLHWLPVTFRVTYKLCLSIYAVHVSRSPGYIVDLVTQTYSLQGRDRLRSSAANGFELPAIHHKFGDEASSNAGPAAWNNLQRHITATMDTETFKTSLKTLLFKSSYSL